MAKYNVEEIAAQLVHYSRTAEQIDLMKEFRNAVVQCGPDFKRMLAEVTHEAYANQLPPVNSIALGMMYGMVMGVLMERQRIKVVH